MAIKNPNPVDIYVGSRVRLQRLIKQMSQDKLGAALGVTFQQVQKYERGANRVSASRLWGMAEVLDVPIEFFFDGIKTKKTQSALLMAKKPQWSMISSIPPMVLN